MDVLIFVTRSSKPCVFIVPQLIIIIGAWGKKLCNKIEVIRLS